MYFSKGDSSIEEGGKRDYVWENLKFHNKSFDDKNSLERPEKSTITDLTLARTISYKSPTFHSKL